MKIEVKKVEPHEVLEGHALSAATGGNDVRVEFVVTNMTHSLSLRIDDFRLQEFRILLQRGLNTWDTAPPWLLSLSDLLDPRVVRDQINKFEAG